MISVQLWSVRREIAERGWDAVLDDLAAGGFAHVEPFDLAATGPLLAPALHRTGLTTPTGHGDLVGDALVPTLAAAAERGVTVVVHPHFGAERWQDAESVARVADDLDRAADAAAGYGMRVAFHHHDDELRTLIDGRPALLALMDRVGPSVGVEFDPNWTTIAGADVPTVAAGLGDRILALHLKDGPAGGANTDQVAVGDGDLDWPAFLAALPGDLPHVVGLDEFAGDTLAAVLRSREWLVRHRVAA